MIPTIQTEVEVYFRLPPGSLRGYDRRKTVARARIIAMTLSRQYTDASWFEISDKFKRHHTTAIKNVKNNKNKILCDPDYLILNARYRPRGVKRWLLNLINGLKNRL